MTLHPPKAPLTCDHVTPVFGCDACIRQERLDTLAAAKRTTPTPRCPACRGAMVLYDSDPVTMTLYYLCCEGHDDEGIPNCEGEVEVKVR